MSRTKITMKFNKKTGQSEIIVDFESERDALRHEHEKKHRQRVKEIVGDDAEIERLSGQPAPRSEQEGTAETLSNQN